MSYQERRALVSFLTTIALAIGYAAWMAPRYPSVAAYAPEVFQFWGGYFLLLIPITIGVRIAIAIAFSILHTLATHEAEPAVVDERDRLVELRANSSAGYLVGVGFMLGMAALLLGWPPAAFFIILLCAGVAAELLTDARQFFLYRRGF